MNTNTKVFGIGISGLIGSRVAELLSDRYTFDNLSTETGVDITNPETLSVIEADREHSVVIHFAAKTDVDGCEQDKTLGEDGAAWKINVTGTENVIQACRTSGKKLLYISTDFVFNGEKPSGESYTEDDTPDPINWYGVTKYEGEKKVSESGLNFAILRPAYPYRSPFPQKKDLVQAIKSKLEAGQEVKAVVDHLMCPTYVDDFAEAIARILDGDAEGIYHTVGSQAISPFDLAHLIAREFHLDESLIKETTREEFFAGRAKRPFNLSLDNAKIEKLGVSMRTVSEGLAALHNN